MNEAWKQWEGEVADGKFRLRQYLGDSERGPVFLTEFGEQEPVKAAIKLIPADSQNADAQLARWAVAANLMHPHLLRVLQTGRCQVGGARLLYVVMECADEDLSHVVSKRALTLVEASEMLRPVLEALAYLHGKVLVHGHVKPANIVAVGEQLKISSDGICAARDTNGWRGNRPTAYDAPEAGTRGCSAAGDVWSLGVTLVEVLTQQLPAWEWKGQEEPELPKAIPAPFGDIARQCLRRDPQRRCTLADIATRLDPDAPPLGNLKTVEERVIAPPQPPARAPKPVQAVKPEAQAKPKAAAAKTPSASPKRSYAIPAIAIGAVALVAIFAMPKLLHRGPEASPDPVTSAPEQPETQPRPKKSDTRAPAAAEKLAAKRSKSSELAPAAAVATTAPAKPEMSRPSGDVVRGAVLHQVLPDAPRSALDTIQGAVRVGVRVNVDASGRVVAAELESAGPSKYFANLAVKAARNWEFAPAKVDGQSAPSEWVLRFEFAQDGAKVTSTEKSPT
jgi:eukaryotic-like serine/threonine-protein kinase